jgi:hypothetical protein
MENKRKLIEALKLWLKKKRITTDTTFYSIEEWRERKEEFHNDAEFVIITEGGLHTIVNHGNPTEFYDLLQSFGYKYEISNPWNIGIYVDPKKK